MKKITLAVECTLPFLMLTFFISACNNKPDDAEIQQTVTNQLQADANYKDVTAAVNNGVVTLDGSCEGENCATDVAQKVKDLENVDSVENNVQVKASEIDLTLRSSVQTIISKYQGVEADVANGIIVLRGTISRDQLQPLMNELSNLNPEKIDNQLAIQ